MRKLVLWTLPTVAFFFKLVLRTLGPEYLGHFLALFGFVAQPKLLLAWNLDQRNSTSIR